MINIYQVLPRLFGNTVANNNPNGTLAENGCGKLNDFNSKALSAIKDMGFTHIWYTGVIEHATQTSYSSYNISADHQGVVKGLAGSPYAIKDYYDIAPDLAVEVPSRMQEFENLVYRTHQADLQVIIDFVPNHVARQYKSDAKPSKIKDLGQNDRSDFAFSPKNNFYYIPYQDFTPQFDAKGYQEFPAKATGNDQFTASPTKNDWYETVKLNYGVDYQAGKISHFDPIPDTWQKMYEILLFWANKKVDGFRCDMAEMVPVEFWAWVIPKVKAKYSQLVFIAEVYNPSEYRNYIFNGKFDYLYDKVGLYDTLRAITCNQNKWASDITSCWQSVNDIQPHMLNFLENHDEQRVASEFFAGKPEKIIPALIVSALFFNSPFMVYFGQELGEPGMDAEGFSGLDGRTTIFDYWSINSIRSWVNGNYSERLLNSNQRKLRALYKNVLSLRLNEKAFSEGISYDLMWVNYDNPNVNCEKQFAFLRSYKKELFLIVVNFDDKDASVELNIPQHAFDFLKITSKKDATWTDVLSGNSLKQTLSSESKFFVPVGANNGVVLKRI